MLAIDVFQNFGININATLDPYRVTPQGQRINKLFFPGRVVSASTSFGYTFQSRQDNSTPAINGINIALRQVEVYVKNLEHGEQKLDQKDLARVAAAGAASVQQPPKPPAVP